MQSFRFEIAWNEVNEQNEILKKVLNSNCNGRWREEEVSFSSGAGEWPWWDFAVHERDSWKSLVSV
jgi:hypothetical protein